MVLEILNLAGDGQVMATKISLDVLGSLLALVDPYAVVGRTDRHVGLAVSIALAISTRPDLVDVCLDCKAAGEKMDCESNDPIEADDLSINALSKAADLLAAHLFLIINDDDDAGTHAEELAERLPVRMLGMVATRAATVPNFVKKDLPGIVVGLLTKMSRRQEFVAGSTNCIVDDVVQFINALYMIPALPLEHRTLFMARLCDLVRLVALHGTDEGDRTTLCELIDFESRRTLLAKYWRKAFCRRRSSRGSFWLGARCSPKKSVSSERRPTLSDWTTKTSVEKMLNC